MSEPDLSDFGPPEPAHVALDGFGPPEPAAPPHAIGDGGPPVQNEDLGVIRTPADPFLGAPAGTRSGAPYRPPAPDPNLTAFQAANSGVTPDRAAQALALSKQTGLGPQLVADTHPTIQQKVDQAQLADTFARTPVLHDYAAQSYVHASSVKDDLSALGWLEWAITGKWEMAPTETDPLSNTKPFFGTTPTMVQAPIWMRDIRDLLNEPISAILGARQALGDTRPETDEDLQQIENGPSDQDVRDESLPGKVISFPFKAAGYIGGSLASGGAGFLAGGPVGAGVGVLGFNWAYSFGPTWRSLRALQNPDGTRMLSDNEARTGAVIGSGVGAAAMSAIELATGSVFGTKIAPQVGADLMLALLKKSGGSVVKDAVASYGVHVVSGAAAMAAQAAGQALVDESLKSRHGAGDESQIWERTKNAFIDGLEGMLVMGAVGPAREALETHGRVLAAKADAARIETMVAAAEQSKVAQRAPDQFSEITAKMAAAPGAASTIYVDRDAAEKAELPAVKTEESTATGGRVRMTPAEFLAELAPKADARWLIGETTLSPDGTTLREAGVASERLADQATEARAAASPKLREAKITKVPFAAEPEFISKEKLGDYQKAYSSKFAGEDGKPKGFPTPALGTDVRIANTGIRETFKYPTREVRSALQVLPELLQNAVKDRTKPDPDAGKKSSSIKATHYLYAPVDIDGTMKLARMSVRETKSGDSNFYELNTLEIKDPTQGGTPSGSSGGPASGTTPGPSSTASGTGNVASAREVVKPPSLPDRVQAEMTPAARAAYATAREKSDAATLAAIEQAKEAKLERAVGAVGRGMQGAGRVIERDRAEIHAAIEKSIDTDPEQRAARYLTTGELNDPNGDLAQHAFMLDQLGDRPKIDRAVLERYREVDPSLAATLEERYGSKLLAARGGYDPDFLAEALGFNNGHELLESLATVPDRETAINQATQAELERKYPGLIDTPQEIADRVLEAQHTPEAAGVALTELNEMLRQIGVPEPQRASMEALKAKAKDIVGKQRVGDLQPSYYLQSERSAAAKAQELGEKGDLHGAAAAKDQQIISMLAWREARDARDEAIKAVSFLKRFTTDDERAKLGKAGPGYLDQVDRILESIELKASQNEVGRRAATIAWMQREQAADRDPVVPQSVLDKLDRTTHWKTLTLQELRDMRDAVANPVRLAELKNTLIEKRARVDFDNAKSQLLQGLLGSLPASAPTISRNVETVGQKAGELAQSLKSALIRPEVLLRQMDGGDLNGPWTRLVWNPINDSKNDWLELARETATPLMRALDEIPAEDRARLKATRIAVNGQSFTMEEALTVALNMGNESNDAKMMKGWSDPVLKSRYGIDPWTEDTREQIVSHLSRGDWQLVQKIWDRLESLWPRAAELERKLTGLAPEKIEPRPFTRTLADGSTVDLKGGYYPMVYDPRFSTAGAHAEEATNLRSIALFDPLYQRAATPQGHLQERADGFAQPISLALDGVQKHITQASKDIAMRESLISVNKILTDPDVRATMQRTIGESGVKALDGWLRDAANQLVIPDGGERGLMNLINKTRSGIVGASYMFRISTALQNLASYSNALVAVPADRLAGGVGRFMRERGDAIDFVHSKSSEMRNRAETFNQNIGPKLRELAGQGGQLARAQELGYWMMETTDKAVAYPTWLGAYEHALAPTSEGGLGHTDELAVRHADQVVRLNVYSGATTDLPAIMRSPVGRLFTIGYGWANITLNQMFAAVGDAKTLRDNGAARYAGIRRIAQTMALIGASSIVASLLRGSGPDPDSDGEIGPGAMAKWAALNVAEEPLGWVPVLRDASKSLLTGEEPDADPFAKAFAASFKTLHGAAELGYNALSPDREVDEQHLSEEVKQAFSAVGTYSGLPVGQIETTAGFLHSSITGTEEPPSGPADAALGLVYGKRRKGTLRRAISLQ